MTQAVYADRRPEDLAHLQRIERWGKISSFIGYATAWLGFNPISVVGIGLGISARWTIAHHVLHRGYDSLVDADSGYHSTNFGRGYRRWIHWFDWFPVRAWIHEHNGMHHYRLGEEYDPDVPEVNFSWLARQRFPRSVKYVLILLVGLIWKWSYYGPRMIQISSPKERHQFLRYRPFSPATWNPFHKIGRRVWTESWLPYAALRFGVIPLLFFPLGRTAWLSVLLNSFAGDLLSSLHSFITIVPNHAGSDVPRFETAPQNKNEHRLRQIVGSVNFSVGSDWNDLLHGWLNYQIEHHVWPDLSLRQYQTWQPNLKKLCEKHGIIYRQENVGIRFREMVRNVAGDSRMLVFSSLPVT